MYQIIILYLTFLQIGAVSFGGGYAMLPFIEEEIIHKMAYLNDKEFLDILAISQMTPGPIAINVATFIGFKYGIIGSTLATLGVATMPFLYTSSINLFLDKFKNSKKIKNILLYIRPITISLILSAFVSTFLKSVVDIKSTIIFAISFIILYNKKLHPILVIFLFGIIGIIIEFI